MTEAKVVAHSIDPNGNELLSILATFPRIILAEVNTHRMLSKNTASSRAIPFFKMLESVINNPFIPIAWQTHHKGMQGSEYISMNTVIPVSTFFDDYMELHEIQAKEDKVELSQDFYDVMHSIKPIFNNLFYNNGCDDSDGVNNFTIRNFWIKIRDITIMTSSTLYTVGKVSKQICNRLLEPFMWTTMLITGPVKDGGWDNFFNLRCPQYTTPVMGEGFYSKSWKDLIEQHSDGNNITKLENMSIVEKLQHNTGAAEIHMMQLAECIWDALYESNPKKLNERDWHIPFGNKISEDVGIQVYLGPSATKSHVEEIMVKISTAMAAQTSYTIIGDNKVPDYNKLITLHDKLIAQNPPHSSPMEHCARVMTKEEYYSFVKGESDDMDIINNESVIPMIDLLDNKGKSISGWCRNFRGFIPYRHIVENESIRS